MPDKQQIISFEERLDQLEKNVFLVNKDIFTVDEVSTYTGFKKSYIYKLTHRNDIPHYSPIGGKLFFLKQEIDDWILSNKTTSRIQKVDNSVLTTDGSRHILSKMSKPTLKILLDTRHKTKYDTFPVKLRISYNHKSHYCSLDLYFTEDEWCDIEEGKEIRHFNKTIIHNILIEADKVLQLQTPSIIDNTFSFEDFNISFLKLYTTKFSFIHSNYSNESLAYTFDDILDFAVFCFKINQQPSPDLLNSFLFTRLNENL